MPLSSASSSSSGHPRRGIFSSFTSDEHSDDLLLCGEDAGSLSDEESRAPRGLLLAPGARCPAGLDDDGGGEGDDEEVAAAWVGAEADHSPELGYRSRFCARSGHLDPAAPLRSVAWILKQQPGGWPVQLLAVACLSLAAKMEETLVPSLLDLQVEDARFLFEPRTIQRMELLVLEALNWRLRSITPFAFVGLFACKADPGKSLTVYLASRATRIILSTTEEIEFLGHCPSAVAAAAVACAAREAPALSSISPESAASWCAGLTRDGIANCYQLMQELVVGGTGRQKQQRRSQIPPPPPPPPLLRISTPDSVGSEISSPTSTSPSSSSSSSKRRKLSGRSWVVDDSKGRRPTKESDGID